MILPETQKGIRDEVRAFAQQRIQPSSLQFEADRGYADGVFPELTAMGMIAPQEHGGAGLDPEPYALALIEVAAADGAKQFITSGCIGSLAMVFAVSGHERLHCEASGRVEEAVRWH